MRGEARRRRVGVCSLQVEGRPRRLLCRWVVLLGGEGRHGRNSRRGCEGVVRTKPSGLRYEGLLLLLLLLELYHLLLTQPFLLLSLELSLRLGLRLCLCLCLGGLQLLLLHPFLLLAQILGLHSFLLCLLLVRIERCELGLHLRELGLQACGVWRRVDKREGIVVWLLQLGLVVKERRSIRVVNSIAASRFLLFTESDGLLQVLLLRTQSSLLSLFLCQRSFALLDRLSQLIFVPILPSAPTTPIGWSSVPWPHCSTWVATFIVITRPTADHAVTHVCAGPSLFTQSALVSEEICDVLGLLPNIGPLIFALFIHVLELLEGFDDVDIIPEVYDNVLGPGMQTVVQNRQRLHSDEP